MTKSTGKLFYRASAEDLPSNGGFQTSEINDTTIDHPSGYIAEPGLVSAVNVALLLAKPLLVTGEPGTGKTQLAHSVAWQLWRSEFPFVLSPTVEVFETKSSSNAKDLFYTFDTLGRFHASHHDASAASVDFITFNAMGRAVLNAIPPEDAGEGLRGEILARLSDRRLQRKVVLIDEIDKAPRDFPNDLLTEFDEFSFKIPELRNIKFGGRNETSDLQRPIVIITSNSEKSLSIPFLRRCVYYHIPFPKPEQLERILISRLAQLLSSDCLLLRDCQAFYFSLRQLHQIQYYPSPSELIDWIRFMISAGAHLQENLSGNYRFAIEGISAIAKGGREASIIVDRLQAFCRGSN